jgi:hypothetical protein
MLAPTVWGRCIWITVHVVALAFPEHPTTSDRERYRKFYLSIGDVLPCMKCRLNYKRHLSELPIDFYLADRDSLFLWTVKMHNIVNKELGKREWSIEEAKDFYMNGKFNAPPSSHPPPAPKQKTYHIHLIALLIIVSTILFILWLKYNDRAH